MTRRPLLASLFLGSTLVVACGGGADMAPAKSAAPPRDVAPPPEPQTVEEAQKQIAQAADELNGRQPDTKPAAPAESTGGSASDASKAADAATTHLSYQCVSPCRALASMRRAVEALCRMTGESDTKCVGARKTLADNVGKTASCQCSS